MNADETCAYLTVIMRTSLRQSRVSQALIGRFSHFGRHQDHLPVPAGLARPSTPPIPPSAPQHSCTEVIVIRSQRTSSTKIGIYELGEEEQGHSWPIRRTSPSEPFNWLDSLQPSPPLILCVALSKRPANLPEPYASKYS